MTGRPVGGSPAVSVIIIFLDADKYIREAIESVFAQTVDGWELVLVDDGSSDGSSECARWYASQYPAKVRCIEHAGHRNKGMSASRNLGIAASRGALIAFLDADDVWLPGKLERQLAIMAQHTDVGLVWNRARYWHPDGAQTLQPVTVPPGRIAAGGWMPMILASDDNAACPSSVLLRRDLATGVGGFEESFRGHLMVFEDQLMWFKVSMRADVYYDPECLLLYRLHSGSFCATTAADQKLIGRVTLYSRLAELAQKGAPTESGCLSLVARGRLCRELLHASSQGGLARGRLAATGTIWGLVRQHHAFLGRSFSAILLLAIVAPWLAEAACRTIPRVAIALRARPRPRSRSAAAS